MKLNAHLYHKADDYRAEACEIEKVMELSQSDFALLYQSPLRDFDFISENKDWMCCDENGVNHCLLVLGEGSDDGILICSEGYDYARYSTHIPNARQIIAAQLRPEYAAELEKRLSNACDEIISCAAAYDGTSPFRVLISDLQETHGIDETYAPLLLKMLGQRTDVFEFEDVGDEIMAYRQENKQTQSGPLPFAPDRANQLLDKALDWIGTMESGGELYNTLVEKLNMSDEEISAAGFDTLSEYFEDPDEDENAGMKLE
jgi:hypothetical protein